MRLWSIHPKYLDAKGLTALWREALLARAVLEGKTKGYTKHPQLERFKASKSPAAAINRYLETVYDESCRRGYCFNKAKLKKIPETVKLRVTTGQLRFEAGHLMKKLLKRDRAAAKLPSPSSMLIRKKVSVLNLSNG